MSSSFSGTKTEKSIFNCQNSNCRQKALNKYKIYLYTIPYFTSDRKKEMKKYTKMTNFE